MRVLNVYDEHKRPVDVEQLKVKLLKLGRVANIVAEEDFYVGRNEEKNDSYTSFQSFFKYSRACYYL